MVISFFRINKHICIPLLVILCFFAFLMSGCRNKNRNENRNEKKQDFKTGLMELYVIDEKIPFEQEEFEEILAQKVNHNLYYHLSDYMQNYIGETVDYLVFFTDPSHRWYEYKRYVIVWSPQKDSGLNSTSSFIRLYDNGKIEYNQGLGSFGSNSNDMYFDKESRLFEIIDQYVSLDAKFSYEGSLFIPEPTAPDASDFESKEEIIEDIIEVMEEYSYFSLEFSDHLDIYVMGFNENDAVTSILLVPDDNLYQAINVAEYRITEKEADVRSILYYAEADLERDEEDEVNRRYIHLAERMMESAIQKTIYP